MDDRYPIVVFLLIFRCRLVPFIYISFPFADEWTTWCGASIMVNHSAFLTGWKALANASNIIYYSKRSWDRTVEKFLSSPCITDKHAVLSSFCVFISDFWLLTLIISFFPPHFYDRKIIDSLNFFTQFIWSKLKHKTITEWISVAE